MTDSNILSPLRYEYYTVRVNSMYAIHTMTAEGLGTEERSIRRSPR